MHGCEGDLTSGRKEFKLDTVEVEIYGLLGSPSASGAWALFFPGDGRYGIRDYLAAVHVGRSF